jgi:hypothetical protein
MDAIYIYIFFFFTHKININEEAIGNLYKIYKMDLLLNCL